MSDCRVMTCVAHFLLWERRKSRLQSSNIMACRDLRRSHKTPDIGSTACA